MRHLGLRLIVDVVRAELSDIGTRDQLVDIALHRREPREIHRHGRRDDRMMRRNLRVVPRTRLLRRICCLCPRRKRRIGERGEIAENLRRILVLAHGQVLCIGARIAGQFFLVQLLCRIEHLLRLIAIAFAREHLQGRKRKEQRRRLLLFLALILRHHAVCGRRTKRRHGSIDRRRIHEPPLSIERRTLLRRLPPRTERLSCRCPKDCIDEIVGRGRKVLDLALTPHDECQCRRLDPADGQDEPRMTCPPRCERIGT